MPKIMRDSAWKMYSSSFARVMATYAKRRSSSTSDGTYTLAMPGKMFSSMPGRNTTGNSRPFAECTVMSTTESALLS